MTYIITYVLLCISLASPVVIAIVLAISMSDDKSISSVASIKLRRGTCDSNLEAGNFAAHLLLNLIGTIVVASSNYLQQSCISSGVMKTLMEMKKRGIRSKFACSVG